MLDQILVEKVKDSFNLKKFLEVQKETIKALQRIASKIQIGMTEAAAYELAKLVLNESGFEKNWHRPYIRFGQNTALMYGQPSDPETILKENDVFYVDIGPVKEGYEGDAGDTFLKGQSLEKERCIQDSKTLFEDVRTCWKRKNLTGMGLYQYAEVQAEKMGWRLNRDWGGHRIGDFPHHLYYKGALQSLDFTPLPGLWVLEIHLCDIENRFGAFYEDVLIE
jgi:methionine aminopeptidase